MHPLPTLILLLAMAAGEHPAVPLTVEETRGPLKASLTVPGTAESGEEIGLRITLENVSSERQSFRLEFPSAYFLLRNTGGIVSEAPEACPRPSTCSAPALAQVVTMEPGARREFVEHWNRAGKCVPPGSYTVVAKLFAYQDVRPVGTVDAGSFEPFSLQADLAMTQGAEGGPCVAGASRAITQETACPKGGGKLAPVFFDLGQAVLSPEAMASLERDATCIQQHGFAKVVVEGHCDERGSEENNLRLGRRRAEAARTYLVSLGIAAGAIEAVSYSEERPVCTEQTEECWGKNRRADILAE